MTTNTLAISEPAYKKSRPYNVLRYLLGPVLWSVQETRAMRKYAHHSDTRSFDWEWSSINYNRISVVNLLVSRRRDSTYLEIGCQSNSLFDSVPALHKVGVDPLLGGTIRETSDTFFEGNQSYFDVIFIDGLHTYEQVRKDVMNAIRWVGDGGWIALHDMLPRNWIEAHTPMLSRSVPWSGDTWKVAFELSKTEGIDFKIVKIDHGVGVFRVLRKDVTLRDLSEELCEKYFSYYYEHIGELPIVEWEDAQSWLRG